MTVRVVTGEARPVGRRPVRLGQCAAFARSSSQYRKFVV